MTTSFPLDCTYWDVYKELSKLASTADKALDNYPVGSNEWYKAWGYAEGMRQACIQCLDTNQSKVKLVKPKSCANFSIPSDGFNIHLQAVPVTMKDRAIGYK